MRIVAVKFLQAVPVIVIISILAFLLLSLLPGDPAIIIAGEQASPAAVEQVRRQLGLDRPFFEQLAIWLFNLARGDFGSSLILHQSVLSAVVERLPVTLSLAALSISFTIPVGEHALRNALILIITATGILLSAAIGGSVIIEQVFALPGIGQLMINSIFQRDFPVVQAVTLVFAIMVVLVYLLTDVVHALLDPRVRFD
jgi:ABC-type dipeptide/oligopeptide/nickel transport system permease component